MPDRSVLVDIEPHVFRARALLAGLRLMTNGSAPLSEDEQGCVFIMICEAEIAADKAVEHWRRAFARAGGQAHA